MSLSYLDADGEQVEIPLSEVEAKCEDGILVDDTQVWMDGMDGWTDFGDAMEFIMAKMEEGVTEFTYSDGDEQVEAKVEELPGLISAGTITDDSLIYYDGLSEWTAFSEVKDALMPDTDKAETTADTKEAPVPAPGEKAEEDAPAPEQKAEDVEETEAPAPAKLDEEPEPAVSEGVPPEANEELKAAAAHAAEAEAAQAKAMQDKEKAEAEKKAAEDAAAAVDIDSPVFQGKLRAMVAGGLPESHASRCLVACGGDLDKATDLLQGVMNSIGAAASMEAMSDEDMYAKVDELMAEIDTFKVGSISFRQFLSWIKRQSGQKRLSDEMNARGQELFNKFDHDDACCLNREKMKACLIAMEKDAMFGSVMESLMAEKMAELEAAIAAAEEEAAAAAAEAAEAAAEAAAAEAAAAEAKAKAEAEAAAAKAAEQKAAAEKAAAEEAERKAAEEAAKAAAEAKAAEAAAAAAKAAGDAAAAAKAAAEVEAAALAIKQAEEAAKKAAEEAAAAKAAAEQAEAEKAAAEAAQQAAAEDSAPLNLAVDCASNNLVYDPVERTLTFDDDLQAFKTAKLKDGESFALSGLGDADGVYTVMKNDGTCTLTVVEELPCISADSSHEWIPGTDPATIIEGTVTIETGSAACSRARRKQQKVVRKDLVPAYRRLDGEKVVRVLKESDTFRSAMEEMTCDFIEFQLGSVKIPTIEGTQNWGSYKIENLGIKSFEVLPENVTMSDVGSQHLLPTKRGVKLAISNIQVGFDDFTFGFDKTTFPKVKEDGATAKIQAVFSAAVTFKIGCSQADGLQAVDVSADIQVEETPIEVLQGKHKKLYNMLLKAFAERVKTTIEEQLKVVIAASTSVLKAKLEEKCKTVADEILLDLIMPDLEELEEKAVRKLFNSLDKRKRGKLDDKMIGELLKQLGQWTVVLPKKVTATRIEINDGNEDESVVELDQFLEWWKLNASDETRGSTAALICAAMTRKPDGMSPGLVSALSATRMKIGRPEPLSRPPS